MVSFIIFALVGVAAIFVYGWLFGISSLIMKIQRRISSSEGMMAFTSYVEQHSDIMQLSETKLDDSIKLVVMFFGTNLSFWLKIKDGYNEKEELKKLYEAIK